MNSINSYSDMSSLVSQSMNTKGIDELEKMGVDLKNIDEGTRDVKIKRVAAQFEQLMISELLKASFKDEKETAEEEGEEGPLMTFAPVNDFRVMMLSQHIADNGGLGYQDIIVEQIKARYADSSSTQSAGSKEGALSGSSEAESKSQVTKDLSSVRVIQARPRLKNNANVSQAVQAAVSGAAESIRDENDTARSSVQAVVKPVDDYEISSGFGWREDPFDGTSRFHKGIDLDVPSRTPVKSVMSGEVVFSGWKKGYGNMVIVKHEDGYTSSYGHNSELKVKEGDQVEVGEVIALSGSTGRSTGPHLHFEIRKENIALNPAKFLKQNKINVFSKNSEIFNAGA